MIGLSKVEEGTRIFAAALMKGLQFLPHVRK